MTEQMIDHVLLPGQAAAPAGPADMTMMYVVHHAFRRDLRDFGDAVASISIDDRDRWRRLHERWRLFTAELHSHHTKEDTLLWPLLAERSQGADDAESLGVLAEMEAEHDSLDPLLSSCDAGFSALAQRAESEVYLDLRTDLSELTTVLDAHLGHEERDAVAILQRYVPGAEWAVIEREKFRGKPSIAHARRFLPWIFKGLDPATASRVAASGDPVMRLLLVTSRRGFARREVATFG